MIRCQTKVLLYWLQVSLRPDCKNLGSGVPSLRAADKPCPQLQPSLVVATFEPGNLCYFLPSDEISSIHLRCLLRSKPAHHKIPESRLGLQSIVRPPPMTLTLLMKRANKISQKIFYFVYTYSDHQNVSNNSF